MVTSRKDSTNGADDVCSFFLLVTSCLRVCTHTHTSAPICKERKMERRRIEVLQPLLRPGYVRVRGPMTVTMLVPAQHTAWIRDPTTGERVQWDRIKVELDPVDNKEWIDETEDEIPSEEKVIDAIFELANQVAGWEVPRGFVSQVYHEFNVQEKGGFKAQINELGNQIRLVLDLTTTSQLYPNCSLTVLQADVSETHQPGAKTQRRPLERKRLVMSSNEGECSELHLHPDPL